MKKIFDVAIERVLERENLPTDLKASHRFSNNLDEASLRQLPAELAPLIRKYSGESGPTITLDSLKLPRHNVVGIDLTGSEARPSGWCQLINGKAITRRIGTDAELVQATMEAKPDLISIDSPLSLPKGRHTVDDSDPGRREFGITRHCERILKKRGVNVYPSLIRSMQALTARGIRLARLFRSLGVAVIESYPGAAQDIMCIPRKRADLTLLRAGLAEFGISGEFETQNVSHDELDAITSAAVGLFFMSGRFEALGNDEEEYLIIPEMNSESKTWGKRRVIGLSGPISAGKTTVGEFLESRGYAYGRYSQVLRRMLEKRGIAVTRESLQRIGEEVYDGLGQQWLGSELVSTMPQTGDLVIDGLRHPEDHAFLVEKFGPDFLHINIDAPQDVRRERYANEGPLEEFDTASAHRIESNIPKLVELAHKRIWNAGVTAAVLTEVARLINNHFMNEENARCQ